MTAAIIPLTHREELRTVITAEKHGGFIPRSLRAIEFNTQRAFTRFQDSTGRIYWVYLPRKPSTLSARVYPNPANSTIQISVFEQDQQHPSDTILGLSIENWRTVLSMDEGWEMKLADLAGRAMKQAEKQPRCLCGAILRVRVFDNDDQQLFVCANAPRCNHTASIEQYGYTFK